MLPLKAWVCVVLEGSRGRAGQEKMMNTHLHRGWTANTSMGTTNKPLFAASVELGRWLFEVLAEQPTGFYKYLCNKPH